MSRVIEAKSKLPITITKKHIQMADQQEGFCDAAYCVVAEGLKDTLKQQGTPALAVQVGPQRTVIYFGGGREVRYSTPSCLKTALQHYDKTKTWKLPEGEYNLNPICKSDTRKSRREEAKRRRAAGDPAMEKSDSKGAKKPSVFSARRIAFTKEAKKVMELLGQ